MTQRVFKKILFIIFLPFLLGFDFVTPNPSDNLVELYDQLYAAQTGGYAYFGQNEPWSLWSSDFPVVNAGSISEFNDSIEFVISRKKFSLMEFSAYNYHIWDGTWDVEHFNEWVMPHLRAGGILGIYHCGTRGADDFTYTSVMPGGADRETYLARIAALCNWIKANLVKPDGSLYPVLFRPLHEADRTWFWFGTDTVTHAQFKEIWIDFVDIVLNTHNMNNVMFVYAPEHYQAGVYEEDFANRYPGDDYVDIIGMDRYDRDGSPAIFISDIEGASDEAINRGKLFAYTEGCRDLEVNNDSNYWTTDYLAPIKNSVKASRASYMMIWKSYVYGPKVGRSDEADFRSFMNDPFIRTLDYGSVSFSGVTLSGVNVR